VKSGFQQAEEVLKLNTLELCANIAVGWLGNLYLPAGMVLALLRDLTGLML
jgi:hypothetical protein